MVQKIHNVSRDTLETFTSMHDVLGVSELKFQHENASIHNSHSDSHIPQTEFKTFGLS